ncbi:unnamed protein product, partial [Discosporangium mesarthrocarpum]
VHATVRVLEQRVSEAYAKKELQAVSSRIKNADLFEGGGIGRRFLREGDLVKICRNGRKVTYRFFLFNDQLLYAHQTFNGEWKMHEQLLLSLVKVVEAEDKSRCKFTIHHPKKSFSVLADSAEMKRAWMNAITLASEALMRGRLDGTIPVTPVQRPPSPTPLHTPPPGQNDSNLPEGTPPGLGDWQRDVDGPFNNKGWMDGAGSEGRAEATAEKKRSTLRL